MLSEDRKLSLCLFGLLGYSLFLGFVDFTPTEVSIKGSSIVYWDNLTKYGIDFLAELVYNETEFVRKSSNLPIQMETELQNEDEQLILNDEVRILKKKQLDKFVDFITRWDVILLNIIPLFGLIFEWYSGHILFQFPLFFIVIISTVLQLATSVHISEVVFPGLVKYGPLTGFIIAAFWTFIRFVHVTSTCLFISGCLWLLWNGIYPAILFHYQITLTTFRLGIVQEDASWYVAFPILLAFLLSALDTEEGMSFRAILHLSILFTLLVRSIGGLFDIHIEGHISTFFLLIILWIDLFVEKNKREQNRPVFVNRNPPPRPSHPLLPSPKKLPSPSPMTPAKYIRNFQKEAERIVLRTQLVYGEFESDDEEGDPDWTPNQPKLRRSHITQDCSVNRGLCKVCWDEPATVLLEPCLHLCMCRNCVAIYDVQRDMCQSQNVFSLCPICRTRIRVLKHVFTD